MTLASLVTHTSSYVITYPVERFGIGFEGSVGAAGFFGGNIFSSIKPVSRTSNLLESYEPLYTHICNHVIEYNNFEW